MFKQRALFIDCSVNNQTRLGFGACFMVEYPVASVVQLHDVELKRFEDTSSSKLEIQTFNWALEKYENHFDQLMVYTDCQNLMNLNNRLERLIARDFKNSKGELIALHNEYKRYAHLTKSNTVDLIKLKGHQPFMDKNDEEVLFSKVDKAARSALRSYHSRL